MHSSLFFLNNLKSTSYDKWLTAAFLTNNSFLLFVVFYKFDSFLLFGLFRVLNFFSRKISIGLFDGANMNSVADAFSLILGGSIQLHFN